MNFDLVVCDAPWFFSDRLKQSKTKRSAESNYKVMKDQDIINLDVKSIVADDAVLALWVPGSKIDVGIKCCEAWGFKVVQTWIWVKTKQNPLVNLQKRIIKTFKKTKSIKETLSVIQEFDLNECLNFFMGHCFRQTHELCLIAARGKYTKIRKNRSQRSVYIGPALKKHSEKPEALQDRLDIIFPNTKKLEMFARRDRDGYLCLGYEAPISPKEDIRDSIKKIQNIKETSSPGTDNAIYICNDGKIYESWKDIPV